MAQQILKYHSTITAMRQTKSGHTIVQLDKSEEVMVIGFHPDCPKLKNGLQVYDNILYTRSEAPTKLPFKKEIVSFNRRGIVVITVQMSDRLINTLKRGGVETLSRKRRLTARPSALEQADVLADGVKGPAKKSSPFLKSAE